MHAISTFREQLLHNYGRWVRHVGLAELGWPKGQGKKMHESFGSLAQSRTWAFLGPWEFMTVEEEEEWVCTCELHRVVLYLLIHGEAANLRHLPEFLCFLFYCASNALTLQPIAVCRSPTGIGSGTGSGAHVREAEGRSSEGDMPRDMPRGTGWSSEGYRYRFELQPVEPSTMPYPADDYLDTIVTPIYAFLEDEIIKKKERPIDERVMYDDVNEFFWDRTNLEKLLRTQHASAKDDPNATVAIGAHARHAYHALRTNMASALRSKHGVVREMRALFKKTHFERVSMSRVIYVFSRVLIPHAVAWHALLLVAFYDSVAWRCVSPALVTHATCRALTKLYELVPGNRHLSELSARTQLLVLCAYACIPLLYVADLPTSYFVERLLNPHPAVSHCAPDSDYPACPARQVYVFEWVSSGYLALVLVQLVAQHSLLSPAGRQLHGRLAAARNQRHFLGTALHLTVPLTTWIAYATFWLATGGIKLTFGYYWLARPLVVPITALWEVDFSDEGSSSRRGGAPSDPLHGAVRLMAIALRLATPTCVFFFDTNVFYTIMSSICSTLVLAQYRRIGRVSCWASLLTSFDETVQLHGQRLLCHEKAPKLLDVGAHEQLRDWCVEARSHQWQLFARSWNEIVISLRGCDLLTHAEHDEMLFASLRGTGHEQACGKGAQSFFNVPEYLIFPTMISSPVFDSKAWKGSLMSFPMAAPALRQACDLLCWLLVALGLTRWQHREQLRDVLHELASLTQQALAREPNVISSLLALRSSLAILCSYLCDLAHELNASNEAVPNQNAAAGANTADTAATAAAAATTATVAATATAAATAADADADADANANANANAAAADTDAAAAAVIVDVEMSASPPPLTGGEGERGRDGVSATPPPPTPAADARLAHSSTASASRPSTAAGGNARSGVAFRASLFQGHPISMSHLAEHLSRCTRVDRRTRTRLTGATGGSGSLRVSSCVRAVGRASGFKFSSKLGGGGDDEGEGGAQPEGSHSAAQMAIGHARATSTMRSLLNTAPRLTEQQAQSIRESSCMPSDADSGAIHARFQDMADALPLIAEVRRALGT